MQTSESSADDDNFREYDIFRNALGERRGHLRGVGPLIGKPTPMVSKSGPSGSSSYDWQEKFKADLLLQNQQQMEEFQRKMKEDFDKEMKAQYKAWSKKSYEPDDEDEDDD